MNVLDQIKYLCNWVLKFLDSGIKIYNIYLFILKNPKIYKYNVYLFILKGSNDKNKPDFYWFYEIISQ